MNDAAVIVRNEISVVQVEETEVAVVERRRIDVVSIGIQGPDGTPGATGAQGPPGADGSVVGVEDAVINGGAF